MTYNFYLIMAVAFIFGCATPKTTKSNTVKKIKSIENNDLNEKNLYTQESLIESKDLIEMNLNAQDSLKDYSLLVINPDIDMKDIEHYLKIIDPKQDFESSMPIIDPFGGENGEHDYKLYNLSIDIAEKK